MAVIGDFITVAGFSFSELEEQLGEAKDKVRARLRLSERGLGCGLEVWMSWGFIA